jgi:3-oxoacyl-[acyl-carrier protein] reductase
MKEKSSHFHKSIRWGRGLNGILITEEGYRLMRLKGKVALVTGSAKGIGNAIAMALAQEGCDLIINDIDVPLMDGAVQEIKKLGRQAISIAADVRDKEQVDKMIDKCLEVFGKVDILVNNAGGGSMGPNNLPPILIEDITEEQWDWVIDTNLKGTFLCTRAVIKHMKDRKSGKIVNISSLLARIGDMMSSPHYSAAKAGILGLAKHVAKEVGPYGINVNSICPGPVVSGPRAELRWQGRRATGEYDQIVKGIPLGRLGKVDDVASVVVFLCSDESSYITGATIDVNGGYVTL